MADNSTIFTGASRYSQDFQQIIDRSLGIASLPLLQLQQQRQTLSTQSNALHELQKKFSSVETALEAVETSLGASSYSATVSSAGVAKVAVNNGALEGAYSLEVVGLGSKTNTSSKDGLINVTDPSLQNLSLATTFTLTVGDETFEIKPESLTLAGLAEAINLKSSANVQATVVNIGSSASPNYRLSIQGRSYSSESIQLNDGTQDLLDTLSVGTPVTYRVNGLPSTPIESDSRSITISPGVTADLTAVGTTDISITRSVGGISSAITSFVNAYNAAVTEIDKHRGKAGGALTGHGILSTLQQSLRSMLSYSAAGNGAVSTVTDLGLKFNDQGVLLFDSTALAGLSTTKFASLKKFLGSSDSEGLIKAASNALAAVKAENTGAIDSVSKAFTDQIAAQDKKIADAETRIDDLEQSLVAKMNAADALIASLEQQVSYVNDLFKAMRANNER